jgi:hypothetical protein
MTDRTQRTIEATVLQKHKPSLGVPGYCTSRLAPDLVLFRFHGLEV